MLSGLFKLNWRDLVRGLITSMTSAILTSIVLILKNNTTFDWRLILSAGAISGLGYLVKNLLTDENDKFVGVFRF